MIKLIYKAAKFQDKCFVFWGIKIWRELNYTEVTRLNHFWGGFNFSFFYKHFDVKLCYTFIPIIFSLATYVIEGVKLPMVIQNLYNRETLPGTAVQSLERDAFAYCLIIWDYVQYLKRFEA